MPKEHSDSPEIKITEDASRKSELIRRYSSVTIGDETVDVLMAPGSSSVVAYVKPGIIERTVIRYKDRAGNFWKEIRQVVVNKKQDVVFVEKRYKNHDYINSRRRRWYDGKASDWVMQQLEKHSS